MIPPGPERSPHFAVTAPTVSALLERATGARRDPGVWNLAPSLLPFWPSELWP